jgi:hypothetical protein
MEEEAPAEVEEAAADDEKAPAEDEERGQQEGQLQGTTGGQSTLVPAMDGQGANGAAPIQVCEPCIHYIW